MQRSNYPSLQQGKGDSIHIFNMQLETGWMNFRNGWSLEWRVKAWAENHRDFYLLRKGQRAQCVEILFLGGWDNGQSYYPVYNQKRCPFLAVPTLSSSNQYLPCPKIDNSSAEFQSCIFPGIVGCYTATNWGLLAETKKAVSWLGLARR